MRQVVEARFLSEHPSSLYTGRVRRALVPESYLSPTQQRVSEMLLAGKSLAEIGEAFSVDPETVKLHTMHLYSRLGVGRRVELARALEE